MAGRDRISELPDDVLDNILGFLPIEEAARTSVLSTRWRDIWQSLTRLKFDNHLFDYSYEHDPDDGYIWSFNEFYVFNEVVMQHNGPIREFVFDFFDYHWTPTFTEASIDEFFQLVTEKVVEEMHLTFDYRLPGCIYSCLSLKRLRLSRVCVDIKNAPCCIFPNVTSLCFYFVQFAPTSAKDVAANVPMLECLSFLSCENVSDCNITAPKLSSLTIRDLDDSLPVNLDLRSVRTLDLQGSSLKFFGHEEFSRRVQRQQPPALNVEHLSTVYIPDYDMSSAFIDLLQRCTKLCKLDILCSGFDRLGTDYIDAMSELLEGLHSVGQTHKMLHVLMLRSFKGSKPEMHFIKGLLACIPTLEKVVVIGHKTFECNEEFNIIEELLCFPHASTKAEIVFV